MTTIVIPDIHHRWKKIKDYLSDKTWDKLILLGDLWDDFYDIPQHAAETAEYLKELLKLPNFTWILGNHDAAYVYPQNPYLRCSGNTKDKCEVIREVLGEDIYKFQLYYWDEYFLYTHAGLNPRFLPFNGWSPEWMEKRMNEARNNMEAVIYDPIMGAGMARGGREIVGGTLWCDWNEEFEPISNLSQIMGHSPHKEPQRIIGENSINWNLDTHSKHCAIINGGKVTIEEV